MWVRSPENSLFTSIFLRAAYFFCHSKYMLSNPVLLTYVLQIVKFYRGNLEGEDHPTKSIATVSLLVTCAFPSSITLLVDELGTFQIFFSRCYLP